MHKLHWSVIASMLAVALAGSSLRAGQLFGPRKQINTAEASVEVIRELSDIPLKSIPPALLHEAKGVAIFPHMVKAGLLVDHRHGKGVVLVRMPDGSWSDPIFVTMEGTGIGLQAGVEATDLVLVFKNPASLDRILKGKGKLTLGSDISVAAGPIGREAERASDGHFKADVLSYSRSRGLFAGVSLEGSRVNVDAVTNEEFYGRRGCTIDDVLGHRCPSVPAAEALKYEMFRVSMPK
jgi:lipid-binding SYLF domain-containing protein